MGLANHRDHVHQQLNWRYAVKKFDPDRKIPEEDWQILKSSMVLAPSSFGLQPWKFAILTEPTFKERFVQYSWGQTQPRDCSHFVIFMVRNMMDDQYVDVFLNRATKVGEPFHIDVGPNETYGYKFWERQANAVKLSFGEGKTDVVFIPMHLKSNRRDENVNDPDWTKKHRAAEAQALVAKLESLKTELKDADIVLLGDSNFLADDDAGPQILIAGGFTDLNQHDEGTTANWGEGYTSAPFDRIFIPTGQSEFADSKLSVIRSGPSDDEIRTYRRKHSDHYMVTTTIAIGADDDL